MLNGIGSAKIRSFISIIVTSLPCSAKCTAVSQPTNPPPAIITFSPRLILFESTSIAACTLLPFIPGSLGTKGVLPVPRITTSGFSSSISLEVLFFSVTTLTPSLSICIS